MTTELNISPVAQDAVSRELMRALAEVAATDGVVQLHGEAGSGKRFMARWLHAISPRAGGAFVSVDCSTLAPEAQWIGLHGHERGAVRGGFAASAGWFEMAQGGTLLLDEWSALSAEVQAGLLGIWRASSVQRIGSTRHMPLNVRLVLATSHDAVADGEGAGGDADMRAEWAGLLKGRAFRLPGLRERPADILPLAQHFLASMAQHLRRGVPELTPDAKRALLQHAWPGHLRELEAVLQRAMVRTDSAAIDADALGLPMPLQLANATQDGHALLTELDALLRRLSEAFPGQLHDVVVRQLFAHAHRNSHGHQIRAAELLGVSRNVLRGRLIAQGVIDARK